MPTKPLVTVVLPAYNEEAVIERSLENVVAYLQSIEDRYLWELIVLNDGSTDATGDIADTFAANHGKVRVLHHPLNFNLGQALRYAFANANGDYIVTLDSDLSYSPEHIGRLLDVITTSTAKIVVASPYARGGSVTNVPILRRWASRISNFLLSATAKGHLTTLTGMVRAYDRRFLNGLNLKAWDVEVNTEILYKAQLLRAHIVEIPGHLDWTIQREAGDRRSSSARYARSIASQGFTAFLFRPFMFFIVPGFLVLLLALYSLFFVILRTWQEYSLLKDTIWFPAGEALGAAYQEQPHIFIIAGISLVVATQLLATGVISMQAKRYFEELFHLGTSVYRSVNSLDAHKRRDEGSAETPK